MMSIVFNIVRVSLQFYCSSPANILANTPHLPHLLLHLPLNLLKKAKALGDILIVGVKTDALVLKDKGHHPLMSFTDRTAVLEACKYVDITVPESKMNRAELLEKVDVDILVVGDDWYQKKVRGHDYMTQNNKRIVYMPYTTGKSSTILRKTLERFYSEVKSETNVKI